MSKTLFVGTNEIKRYQLGATEIDTSSGYTIVEVDVKNSSYESKLLSSGYRFLDRVFEMDIALSGAVDVDDLSSQGIKFVVDSIVSDDIYELACEVYDSDRRFHLDPVFNQENANHILKQYIEDYKQIGVKVFKAYREQELLGFTIVNENVDEKAIFFENVLGATKPGIKGKMIAAPLYKKMLYEESKTFKKYYGKVSSSNLASINLHFMLGGRIRNIYDEFIYKK